MNEKVEKLKNLAELLKSKKLGKFKGKVERKDLKTGYYAIATSKGIEVQHFKSIEEVLNKKAEHGAKMVHATSAQIATLQQLEAILNDGKYTKALEATKTFNKETDIRGLPVEIQAVASVSAQFQASWGEILIALEAKAEASIAFKGKHVTFTAGLSAVASASAKLKVEGLGASVEVSAKAVGEAKMELESRTLQIGDSNYAVSFFANIRGYATAEASAKAGFNLNPFSTESITGAEAKAFAGIGVAAQVGVKLHGRAGLKPELERMLGSLDGEFSIEVGVGAKGGSVYSAEETTINGEVYVKRTISVELTFMAGAGLAISVVVLKDLEEQFKEKLLEEIKKVAKKIIGEKMLAELETKVKDFQKMAKEKFSYFGHSIAGFFDSIFKGKDHYDTIRHKLAKHTITLGEKLADLRKAQTKQNDSKTAKAIASLEKLVVEYEQYDARVTKIAEGRLNTLISQLNGMKGDPQALAQRIIDNEDELNILIENIELVTNLDFEMISSMNEWDGLDDVKIEHQIHMNDLLDIQENFNASLKGLKNFLKDEIIAAINR